MVIVIPGNGGGNHCPDGQAVKCLSPLQEILGSLPSPVIPVMSKSIL